MTAQEIPLHAGFENLSVLEYLAILWPDRARRGLAALFARGALRTGGRPVSPRRRLGELRDLTLHGALAEIPLIYTAGAATSGAAIDILHEDERFVVLQKPAGVPVVPDRAQALESCLGFLIRRELAARARKEPREYVRHRIVHRLDRLTSGLVIVAKTPEVERRLAADFEARRVEKEYLALLRGEVLPARVTVNCPVAPGRKGAMRAELPAPGARRDAAKAAVTSFDVIRRFPAATLVRARPLTGRTHQIRVHAWAMGHPLYVDPVYGERRGGPVEGLSLHAHRYTLSAEWDPPRSFVSPPPPTFAAAVAGLEGGS
jgi:RluA family pseudouridine synthase